MPQVPLYHHIRPLQNPHPPIAVAGLHKHSESLVTAGREGWIPMSINYLPARNLLTHWDAVCGGAAEAGRTPDRSEEHTSELQSLMRISYAVFCLKKKTRRKTTKNKH